METNRSSKKCVCGRRNSEYCPKCSDVKAAILLKNGCDHLKIRMRNGKLINPVWYSYLKQNGKPLKKQVDDMFERIRKHHDFSTTANEIHFYNNHDRSAPVHKVKV